MTDEGRLSLAIPNWLQIADHLGSVGFEMWIGASKGLTGAILALNDFEILPEYISLSQMVDTAWVEVAERRKDVICRNDRGAVGTSGEGRSGNKQGESERLARSRVYIEVENMGLLS